MIFNNDASTLIVGDDEGPLRISRRFRLHATNASMEVGFYVNGELAKQYSYLLDEGNKFEELRSRLTMNLYPSAVPVDSQRIPEGSDSMRIEFHDAAGTILYEGKCRGISDSRSYGDLLGDVKSFWEEIKRTIPKFEERWQALWDEKDTLYRKLIRGNKEETEENTKKTNSLRQWIKRLFRNFN